MGLLIIFFYAESYLKKEFDKVNTDLIKKVVENNPKWNFYNLQINYASDEPDQKHIFKF